MKKFMIGDLIFSYNMYNFLFDAHSTSYEYPDFFFECTFNHYPDHSTKYY